MDVIDYIAIALIIILIGYLLYFSYSENATIVVYNLKNIQNMSCIEAGGVVKQINVANITIYVCCNKDTKTWMGMYWDVNGNVPIFGEDIRKELYYKATKVCEN